MDNSDKLTQALNELDQLLTKESLSLEIVICGAYAIQLYGITRNIFTQDIDSIKPLESQKVLDIIQQVGSSLGLGPHWLNDQASTVTIPEGIFDRAKPIRKWKSIKASLVDRSDLIKMKAAAFSVRREQTPKDWEDLEALGPTGAEIQSAIIFLQKNFSPPQGSSRKINNEFQETLDDLKKLIK